MEEDQRNGLVGKQDQHAMAGIRPDSVTRNTGRPAWIRRTLATNPAFFRLKGMVKELRLATVCESAGCPNIGECWSKGTVTVMILGDICTRSCRFCGVSHGLPFPPDANEPSRVVELISRLHAAYVVVTSVDRDDLLDGGASHWAETIRKLRTEVPGTTIEVLVPDFRGDVKTQETVLAASPDVLSHNVETVAALQSRIRPNARYRWSLDLLQRAAADGVITKSGLMVGLGETKAQVRETLRELADVGVSMVTIGQYLRPSQRCVPVARYWTPDEFEEIEHEGEALGLALLAGALVRSSYLADELSRRCWNSSAHEVGIP